MYIVRHYVVRVNKDKVIRKLMFKDRESALDYIRDLRSHETLILFKECQRQEERRS